MNTAPSDPTVELCDVTCRDGAQAAGITMQTAQKLWITRMDDRIGVMTEGGFPASNPTDRELFEALRADPLKRVTLTAFGMTRRKDTLPDEDKGLRSLLESGAPGITLVGKSSRFHVEEILQTSLKHNLAMIEESFQFLRERGVRTLLYDAEHLFDAFKTDPDYAMQTLQAAMRGGAQRLVLCDTNGGSSPEWVGHVTEEVRKEFQDVIFGIHPHNDRGLAVANMRTAVAAGVRHVQGTWNGFGERTGNLDLCLAIPNLHMDGYRTLSAHHLKELTNISEQVALRVRLRRPDEQAFVGKNAYAHKGGMHAAAVVRHPRSYEFLPPETFGNERHILGSNQSGLSNVRSLLERARLLSDDQRKGLIHNKKAQSRILSDIKSLEAEGYTFDHADATLELVMLNAIGELDRILRIEEAEVHSNLTPLVGADPFEREKERKPKTKAIVKIGINGDDTVFLEVAEDIGPIGALTETVLQAMARKFEGKAPIISMEDYRVEKVPQSEEGEHAPVIVTVEWKNGDEVFTTTGVSQNSIEAGWECVVDAFEYVLQLGRLRSAQGSQS